MVADDGRTALRIADEHRREHKAHIHKDAVGRNAVRTEQLEQLDVVQCADQRHRDVRHQLARTVCAGLEQRPQAEQRLGEAEPTVGAAFDKIEDRGHAADHLADDRGRCRAGQPQPRHTYKDEVQHHIGRTRCHREAEAQLRLFGCNKKALEQILQHERRLKCQQNTTVSQATGQQFRRCAQPQGHRLQQRKAESAEQHTQHGGCDHQHTEQLIGALFIAGAQRHGNKGAAARADHKAEAAQHLKIRVDEVQRRERRFARVVRDKKAVHNRVNGGKNHHHDGRRRKSQQPPRGKMVG